MVEGKNWIRRQRLQYDKQIVKEDKYKSYFEIKIANFYISSIMIQYNE